MSKLRRTLRSLSLVLTPLVLIGTLLVGFGPGARASSHREAPLIARDQYADNTDVYAFVTPADDRRAIPNSVTLVANWIPFQLPEAGPNYYMFSQNVRYEIHIDNDGDATDDITYRFEFSENTRNPETFLYNTGPVTTLDDEDLNVTQTYSVTEVTRDGEGDEVTRVLARNLPTPPVNVGAKSTPNYESLAKMAVRNIGSGANRMRVFAGQRDDPFFIDVGAAFDLLTLRGQAPPIGYDPEKQRGQSNIPQDGLSGHNVHTIALQVPISQLTAGDDPVIGVWATSHRRSMITLRPLGQVEQSGDFVQVSRLGNPLVNEVVIPRALKDAFNGLRPDQDAGLFTGEGAASELLRKSIFNPELQRLLAALYDVPHPSGDRTDIFEIFLTGIKTNAPFTIETKNGPMRLPRNFCVNQPGCTTGSSKPSTVQPAEMLRLNTAISGDLCKPEPDYQLGLLGGDACGFPNGRRLRDDVPDMEFLVVAGAAYTPVTGKAFNFNNALVGVLDDGIDRNDRGFMTEFPYVATAWSGTNHEHHEVHQNYIPTVRKDAPAVNRQTGLQDD